MSKTKDKKIKKKGISQEIPAVQGITFRIEAGTLIVTGPKGEVKRSFSGSNVSMAASSTAITLSTPKSGKREKKMAGTMAAHIKNMMKGASEGHRYVLKICSGHFPMNVSATNTTFTIKNFLGEKVPRAISLKQGATVTIDGQNIIVESTNKERAGQVAADIEQLTRITKRDPRVFQDGIYIIDKDGKEIK